jgi:uncharacterized protein
MEEYLWLAVLGFIVGTYGTLIGAGGGFVLVPALLLLFPNDNPEIITSISLAVVFFNASSGSWAYGRMKRIDYKSGLLFAAATIPGAILGALSTAYVPRRLFDAILGALMIAASIFLILYVNNKSEKRTRIYHFVINLVDKDGTAYNFSYNPIVGVGFSCLIGYLSTFLGIGGGIIHVPVLVHLLNFPVHIATATSHFILAIMALTGTVVHIITGTFSSGVHRTVALAIGVLLGAQMGALLSKRVRGRRIIQGLAIALAFVGIRILLLVF